MRSDVLGQMLVTFATLSLVAIGGANVVVPDMHRQVVETLNWMSDPVFANLFAIAQTAPGPNIMIASLIGWHVAGWLGLLVATIGILGPSSLIAFGIGRFVAASGERAWVRLVQAGLVPVAVGLILASGIVMARAADRGPLTAAITLGTVVLVVATDRNPLWGIGLGAAAGLMGSWLGWVV